MNTTESDLDKITKSWAASFNEEVLQYAQPATVNDMEVGIWLSCPSHSRPLLDISML